MILVTSTSHSSANLQSTPHSPSPYRSTPGLGHACSPGVGCIILTVHTVHPCSPSPYRSTPGWGYACSPGRWCTILTVHPNSPCPYRSTPGWGYTCAPGGGDWCLILTVQPPQSFFISQYARMGLHACSPGGGVYNTYGPTPTVCLHITVRPDGDTPVPREDGVDQGGDGVQYLRSNPHSLSPYHSTPGWGYACSPGRWRRPGGRWRTILTVQPPQSVSISQYARMGLRLFPGKIV